MTYAILPDVLIAYEDEIPDERQEWVSELILRAERALDSKVSGIQERIDSGELDMLRVTDVIVNAVCRVIRNPEGLLIETEGNYSRQADRAVASGRLFFDADDLAAVRPVRSYGLGPFMSRVPSSRRTW